MSDVRKALIVDDNQTNRILARALLTKLGWQIAEADSGDKALQLAAQDSFQLVLLDISMPGMSGEEACVALRALPGGTAMRIIAYTAHAFPEERARFLAAGFDDILVKPVTLPTMTAVVGA